ncbi:4562_t:CDS:2, partial [Acaulospora colombiana]
AWTSSILKKFSSKQEVVYHPVLPEHTNPTASVSLLGKCHITIGPHTFYDTKIYEAVYEKEVRSTDIQSGGLQIQPSSLTGSQFQPLTHSETQSSTQSVATPPLQSSVQAQSSSTPKVSSYSTASRPIQPAIQPRPANQTQSQVPIQPRGTTKITTRSTPSNSPVISSVPASSMNVQNMNSNTLSHANSNLNSNVSSSSANGNTLNANGSRVLPPSVLPANSQLTALFQTITPSQILVIQEQLRQPQASINMTPEQKNALINQLTTIHQLLTSPQQMPQHQIHSRPQLLTTRSRQIVRYEVLLEFRETKSDKWLFPKETVLEAMSMSEPYDILASFYLPQNEEMTVSKREYQPVTMHLTNLTQSMWDALQRVTNDLTSVLQSMTAKVNKQPNREYLLHCLPCDYPEELLESTKKLKSITKVGEGSKSSKTNSRKIKPVPPMTPNVVHPPVSNSSGGNKKCAYCFAKNTPMWRRGPDGAGTLCNACGVKWKQGKILQGSNTSRATEIIDSGPKPRKYSLSTANSSAATVTPPTKTKRKSGRSLSMSE